MLFTNGTLGVVIMAASNKSGSTSELLTLLKPAEDVIVDFGYSVTHDQDRSDQNHNESDHVLFQDAISNDIDRPDGLDAIDESREESRSGHLSSSGVPALSDAVSSNDRLRELLAPVRQSKLHKWSSLNAFQDTKDTDFIRDIVSYRDREIQTLRLCLSRIQPKQHSNTITTSTAIEVIGALLRCYDIPDAEGEIIEVLTQFESQHKGLILDYYHEIMHSARDSFDSVYLRILAEMKVTECDIEDCRKHYRHRERQRLCTVKRTRSPRVYRADAAIETSSEEAVWEYYGDVLDMMHCNLLHSFDTGMRVRGQSRTPRSTVDSDDTVSPQRTELDELDLDQNFNQILSKRAHSQRTSNRRKGRQPAHTSRIMESSMSPTASSPRSPSESADDSKSSSSDMTYDLNNKFCSAPRQMMSFDFGYKYYVEFVFCADECS